MTSVEQRHHIDYLPIYIPGEDQGRGGEGRGGGCSIGEQRQNLLSHTGRGASVSAGTGTEYRV